MCRRLVPIGCLKVISMHEMVRVPIEVSQQDEVYGFPTEVPMAPQLSLSVRPTF